MVSGFELRWITRTWCFSCYICWNCCVCRVIFFRLHMSEAFLSWQSWHGYVINEYRRALSEVPNAKAIAGVRVGLIGGEFIVNPTVKEMEESQLDLFLAGTDTAILTIEVNSNLYLSLQDLPFLSFFFFFFLYSALAHWKIWDCRDTVIFFLRKCFSKLLKLDRYFDF